MNAAPEKTWICEAQATGAASHEFVTPDPDCARAMCDAHGWELIRVYVKGGDSDRPAWKQLTSLLVEAQTTYRTLTKRGVDMPEFDEWRKDILCQIIKQTSFKAVTNAQYVMVRNTFRSIRGAETTGTHEGKRQSRERDDTLEMRQKLVFLLAEELGKHARREPDNANWKAKGAITPAYLLTLAKAKNPGQAITDKGDLIKLPASRLQHLLYTIRNRIASREGRKA